MTEMTKRCSTCNTPMDEIPFGPCEEHEIWFRNEPQLTQQELDESLEQELAELLYHRTGDD